jgi:hypothetical protein
MKSGFVYLLLLFANGMVVFAPQFPEMQASFRSIEVRLIPDFQQGSLAASAVYRMTPKADSARRLLFLVHDLEFDSVRISGAQVAFRKEADTLIIVPEKPLAAPFDLEMWYKTQFARGVHCVSDSLWVSSRQPGAQAGWMPLVDHPSVYSLLQISAELPKGMSLAANGMASGIDSISGERFLHRFESGDAVRLVDAGWIFGRFNTFTLADSSRIIRLMGEKSTVPADSLLRLAATASQAFSAIERWLGQPLPVATPLVAVLPDLYWERRTATTGFSQVSPVKGDLHHSVKMAAIKQVFGGLVFPSDSVAERWMASALTKVHKDIFGEVQSMYDIPWLEDPARPIARFQISDAVLRRWAQVRGEAEAQDLMQWAWEADGLSHFGMKTISETTRSGPVITAKWIDAKPKPLVELMLDSLDVCEITLVTTLRRDTLRFPVKLDSTVIVTLEMRPDVRNFYIESAPENAIQHVIKPEAFWIHQARTSKTVQQKQEGLRGIKGARKNPDLQLFLFDLLKTEKNPALRAECLATLASYMNGATGSNSLFMDELASPDTAVRKQAVRALRFYGQNTDHASRLVAELRKTRDASLRLEIVKSLSVAMDSTAWMRFTDRMVLRGEHADLSVYTVDITLKKFQPSSVHQFYSRWMAGSLSPWMRAALLNRLDPSHPKALEFVVSALSSRDARVRAAAWKWSLSWSVTQGFDPALIASLKANRDRRVRM